MNKLIFDQPEYEPENGLRKPIIFLRASSFNLLTSLTSIIAQNYFEKIFICIPDFYDFSVISKVNVPHAKQIFIFITFTSRKYIKNILNIARIFPVIIELNVSHGSYESIKSITIELKSKLNCKVDINLSSAFYYPVPLVYLNNKNAPLKHFVKLAKEINAISIFSKYNYLKFPAHKIQKFPFCPAAFRTLYISHKKVNLCPCFNYKQLLSNITDIKSLWHKKELNQLRKKMIKNQDTSFICALTTCIYPFEIVKEDILEYMVKFNLRKYALSLYEKIENIERKTENYL